MRSKVKLSCICLISFISILVLGLSASYSHPVYAKDNPVSNDVKKGLTVSPLRTELELAPGTSHGGKLTITNSTDKSMEVNLNAEVFSVINQQYDYAFTSESDAVKWVNFDSNRVSLLPSGSKEVAYNVGVPLSAEPGGRYISLFATNDLEPSGGNASSRQRIATLLYVTVTGNISRLGKMLGLNSPWLVGGDSIWSATLSNSGSTHYRSRYDVKIKSIFDNTIFSSASGDALILPGTVRFINDRLPLPKVPGVYRVIYTIGLGDTPSITETRLMIYLPYWFAIAMVSVSAICISWCIFKKIKRQSKFKSKV